MPGNSGGRTVRTHPERQVTARDGGEIPRRRGGRRPVSQLLCEILMDPHFAAMDAKQSA